MKPIQPLDKTDKTDDVCSFASTGSVIIIIRIIQTYIIPKVNLLELFLVLFVVTFTKSSVSNWPAHKPKKDSSPYTNIDQGSTQLLCKNAMRRRELSSNTEQRCHC